MQLTVHIVACIEGYVYYIDTSAWIGGCAGGAVFPYYFFLKLLGPPVQVHGTN